MKIKDLITLLKSFDQEMEVIIPDNSFYHKLTENEVEEVFLYESEELGLLEFSPKEEPNLEITSFCLISTNEFS